METICFAIISDKKAGRFVVQPFVYFDLERNDAIAGRTEEDFGGNGAGRTAGNDRFQARAALAPCGSGTGYLPMKGGLT